MIYNKFSGGRFIDNCLVIKVLFVDDKGKYFCIVKNVVGFVIKDIEFSKFLFVLIYVVLYGCIEIVFYKC